MQICENWTLKVGESVGVNKIKEMIIGHANKQNLLFIKHVKNVGEIQIVQSHIEKGINKLIEAKTA